MAKHTNGKQFGEAHKWKEMQIGEERKSETQEATHTKVKECNVAKHIKVKQKCASIDKKFASRDTIFWLHVFLLEKR